MVCNVCTMWGENMFSGSETLENPILAVSKAETDICVCMLMNGKALYGLLFTSVYVYNNTLYVLQQ